MTITIIARPHKGDFRVVFRYNRDEDHISVLQAQARAIVGAAYEAGMCGYKVNAATIVLR